MKAKIGDKIRLNDNYAKYTGIKSLPPLLKGSILTVYHITDYVYANVSGIDKIDEQYTLLNEDEYDLIAENNQPQPKFKIGDIVDTCNLGWQFCDANSSDAMTHMHSSTIKQIKISDIKYSQVHKNYWYRFHNYCNWYSECSITPKPDNYITGRWYKINNCRWAKFKQLSEDNWIMSDSINSSGNFLGGGGSFEITELDRNPTLLEDLSEIQQYLPDNHPDKVKTSIFKVGDIVEFISSKSMNARYFRKGLDNLKIKSVEKDHLNIYESDKSTIWSVKFEKVRHQKSDNRYIAGVDPLYTINNNDVPTISHDSTFIHTSKTYSPEIIKGCASFKKRKKQSINS
jgi:signal peptidase I